MNIKRTLKKKRIWVPVAIIVLLVVVRIALPYVVKNYVNRVLADIPGYYGKVQDIDIALIRGAYVIEGLALNRVDAESTVPFLDFEKTDISIEWGALFKGHIVSEIEMTEPKFYYVFEDQQQVEQNPDYDDWTKALTDLVPIDINNLKIINGKAAFLQLNAEPNIDLHFSEINLSANNLRNVVQKSLNLPSEIKATAVSIGGGNVSLSGKMDLVKKIPDMDISFKLEQANATAMNDFTKHYAKLDFDSGSFNLYSEVAIANGFLTGYVKPILKDAKLIGEDDGFLSVLWEGFVGFFKFILKNKSKNTLATNVPIEGDLNNVKGKVWPTIFNTVRNGWVKAFENQVDGKVDFEDAVKGSEEIE
ncbi:DUF748 domain-containing protein [Flagellimonas sp. 389]|uniref:DUF748 domain-containing protein n=1 Tax=Flagellimonas sp. 389 TaxID=2835862 RepID=UPI001BD30E02|nr:DUF748 domain-containing protein [Flagellimonas sp. 389]MBS9464291.1 DUF748 domain-containing protein [Flagellimonas sp. 389]